jgi:hypothetical protein
MAVTIDSQNAAHANQSGRSGLGKPSELTAMVNNQNGSRLARVIRQDLSDIQRKFLNVSITMLLSCIEA